jgi:O-antigen ligase
MAAVVAHSRSRGHLDRRWIEVGLWAAMGLGLALCYVGQTLPVMTTGLLLLGGLALLRPDLALLLVPLTAPLFLTPLVVPTSGRHIALPPHELALLVSAAAALPNILVHVGSRCFPVPTMDDGRWTMVRSSIVHCPSSSEPATHIRRALLAKSVGYLKNASAGLHRGLTRLGQATTCHAPEVLLLIAGLVGLSLAVPEPQARGDALRAFRWFIAEPLIFVALIRLHALWPAPGAHAGAQAQARRLLNVFVIGGAAVALLGLLQFAGYLLHAQIAPESFAVGGGLLGRIQRVTSVYGNPNNLALYIGRVWPLAAALALAAREEHAPRWLARGYWLCVLLCLGALLLSLSRGAWLGAGAALIVLMLPATRRRFGGRRLPGALIACAIVVTVGALIFALRGGPLGGSAHVRILFWQESIKLLERQPLGVGLDQFFYYHHPAYGRSLIDPVLANTQERYARQPHNLVFEIWFNLGPLGVIAFGWLLVRCLRRARSGLRFPLSVGAGLLARGVIAALAAALVHGLVDSFYFWPDIAIALWLVVGVSELMTSITAHPRADEGIIAQ